jgi:putative transposase
MARKRRTPEQIVAILREADRGRLTTEDLCKQEGVSEQTFYRWRKQYGGVGTPEVQRIRQLERENQRLKQLAGDQALANQLLKEELGKRGTH